jgi:hypothetical protein
MKKRAAILFLFTLLATISHAYDHAIWQQTAPKQAVSDAGPGIPAKYISYRADLAALKSLLNTAAKGTAAQWVDLPTPDGRFRTFRISNTPMLPAVLARKYPELSTYTAVAIDNPHVTAKLDFTVYGFHAMIFDGAATSFIDPANNINDGQYMVHYKKDEVRSEELRSKCLMPGQHNNPLLQGTATAQKSTAGTQQRISNGTELRTYRLALSCDHQYAQIATALPTPTVAQVLSKMMTTMNRVNGVYERELSITMVFTAKEDTLIFTSDIGDPFGSYNNDASGSLAENQVICDSFIGNTTYDIGHIFTTGAGGLSQLGVVCNSTLKAQSVTGSATPTGDGFDIDYVAHEMGHEFGSQHTFNNNSDASCAGNAVEECAFEPGSGSTIMCYAGICQPDNLQKHSDAYFSGSSLQQIQSYIVTGGDGCAVKTATNNKIVGLPSFSTEYTIPALTPFELTAPVATDSVADTETTYCWEQWDLGDFGKSLSDTHIAGPIFRSYPPVNSTTRMFPNRVMILADSLNNAGTNNASGEKVPEVSRLMNFRVTVRNIIDGHGCFLIPDDSIHLNVIATGAGFKVTSHNTDGLVFSGNTGTRITWNVAGTNALPIGASTVDIYMSADSGATWPYIVGTFPNSGGADVNIPNPVTDIPGARFKVKGSGNVFFNMNSKYFRVNRNFESAIQVYPVPTHSVLHVTIENSAALDVAVYNAIGRCEWKGTISGPTDLPAYLWARGVYCIKFVDKQKRVVIRKFTVD